MIWRCWLGGRKGIRPVKNWVVGCWCGYLERGADLHTAQLLPLPLTVSCSSKIQIGFTFLVPAHLGSPGKKAVKRVCVCVCVCVAFYSYVFFCFFLAGTLFLHLLPVCIFTCLSHQWFSDLLINNIVKCLTLREMASTLDTLDILYIYLHLFSSDDYVILVVVQKLCIKQECSLLMDEETRMFIGWFFSLGYFPGLTLQCENDSSAILEIANFIYGIFVSNFDTFAYGLYHMWEVLPLPLCCRFLLARHRAALDVYNEAQKMSPKDWVIDNCHWLYHHHHHL